MFKNNPITEISIYYLKTKTFFIIHKINRKYNKMEKR